MNLSTVVNLVLEQMQQQAIRSFRNNARRPHHASSTTQRVLIQTFAIGNKSDVCRGLQLEDFRQRQTLGQILSLTFRIKRQRGQVELIDIQYVPQGQLDRGEKTCSRRPEFFIA